MNRLFETDQSPPEALYPTVLQEVGLERVANVDVDRRFIAAWLYAKGVTAVPVIGLGASADGCAELRRQLPNGTPYFGIDISSAIMAARSGIYNSTDPAIVSEIVSRRLAGDIQGYIDADMQTNGAWQVKRAKSGIPMTPEAASQIEAYENTPRPNLTLRLLVGLGSTVVATQTFEQIARQINPDVAPVVAVGTVVTGMLVTVRSMTFHGKREHFAGPSPGPRLRRKADADDKLRQEQQGHSRLAATAERRIWEGLVTVVPVEELPVSRRGGTTAG